MALWYSIVYVYYNFFQLPTEGLVYVSSWLPNWLWMDSNIHVQVMCDVWTEVFWVFLFGWVLNFYLFLIEE